MTATLRIARQATRVGYEDVRAQYTWKSWLFGWITRATAQVLFFAAMGLLVGGEDLVLYAFVGNAAAMAALMPLGTASACIHPPPGLPRTSRMTVDVGQHEPRERPD